MIRLLAILGLPLAAFAIAFTVLALAVAMFTGVS